MISTTTNNFVPNSIFIKIYCTRLVYHDCDEIQKKKIINIVNNILIVFFFKVHKVRVVQESS